jgi:cytochrome c-type biogenesis protein CcmH/NrfF
MVIIVVTAGVVILGVGILWRTRHRRTHEERLESLERTRKRRRRLRR